MGKLIKKIIGNAIVFIIVLFVFGMFSRPQLEPPFSYTVQNGDTIFSVAHKLGYSDMRTFKNVLSRYNDLKTDNLHPGQILKVVYAPGATGAQ